jgi:hypothetical protein
LRRKGGVDCDAMAVLGKRRGTPKGAFISDLDSALNIAEGLNNQLQPNSNTYHLVLNKTAKYPPTL